MSAQSALDRALTVRMPYCSGRCHTYPGGPCGIHREIAKAIEEAERDMAILLLES